MAKLGTYLLFILMELLLVPSGLRLGTLLNILRTISSHNKESSPEGPCCRNGKLRPRLQGKVGSDKVLCVSRYSGPISSSKGSLVQLASPQSILEQFGFMRQMYYQTLQSPESVIHFWECVPVLKFKMHQNLHPRGLALKPYLQTPKSNKQMSKNNKKETSTPTRSNNKLRQTLKLHKTAIS